MLGIFLILNHIIFVMGSLLMLAVIMNMDNAILPANS